MRISRTKEGTEKYLDHILFVFFFSSRRRHTRLQGDWSSDVCSSDLLLSVRGLSGAVLNDVSFDVAGGEVVGVGGLTGSGREELLPLLFGARKRPGGVRSEEHTSELQSPCNLVCRLLLEKKKKRNQRR